MRLTVLGSCGAWPEAGQARSGYLVEHDRFRVLVDLGYAAVPRLLERVAAVQVGAVLISHGNPDHCADLNPLLRAGVLGDDRLPALPVYALPAALDAVLALDRPGMPDRGYVPRELSAGRGLVIGPFQVETGCCRIGCRTRGSGWPPGGCWPSPVSPDPAQAPASWPGPGRRAGSG